MVRRLEKVSIEFEPGLERGFDRYQAKWPDNPRDWILFHVRPEVRISDIICETNPESTGAMLADALYAAGIKTPSAIMYYGIREYHTYDMEIQTRKELQTGVPISETVLGKILYNATIQLRGSPCMWSTGTDLSSNKPWIKVDISYSGDMEIALNHYQMGETWTDRIRRSEQQDQDKDI